MSTSTDSISTGGLELLYKAAEKVLDQADNAVKVREQQLAEAEAVQSAALDDLLKWSAILDARYDKRVAA